MQILEKDSLTKK